MAAENIHDVFSDDLNYEVWAPSVKARLVENGVWDVVANGVAPDPTKIPELASTIKVVDLAQWRNRVIKDMKALKIIQSSLTDSAFRKSLSVASAKDLWDLLKKGKSNEEAKLRRLEKEFEELMMYEEEPIDNYLGRVVDIVDGFQISGNPKPDYEVIMKLLTSLAGEYDIVLPVLEEFMELPDMTLKDLINILDLFGSRPGEYMLQTLQDFYKSIRKAKSEQKWCGVCKKYNHNQVDCYYKPTGASQFRGHCFRCGEQGHRARACSNTRNEQMVVTHAQIDECGEQGHCARDCNNTRNQQMVATHAQMDQKGNEKPSAGNPSGGARQFRGHCFRCGEQGHCARDCCNTRNQQMVATHAQIDQKSKEKPKHQMLTATFGDFTYDEDMWMLYTASTDHMTPYVKFFTTLDRTYRAEVELGNGSVMMAEGKGDVMIMMKGVKVTIMNVLFVPRINRNVLSFGKMAQRGYSMESSGGECIVRDKTGKFYAKTRRDERGIALRLQVIEGR